MLTTPWFVTTVRPQHEAAVVQQLAVREIEHFAPTYRVLRRWSDRKKTLDAPLFPGYVFCRFEAGHRARVLKTPGVTSIVGFGGEMAPVAADEMDRVRAMVGSGLAVEPLPYLHQGDRVRILQGPLTGMEGLIVQIKSDWRLVVSVTLLQRSVAVGLDHNNVARLGQGCGHTKFFAAAT